MFLLRVLLQLIKGHLFLIDLKSFSLFLFSSLWRLNLGPCTCQSSGKPTTELHPQLSSFLNTIGLVLKRRDLIRFCSNAVTRYFDFRDLKKKALYFSKAVIMKIKYLCS